MTELNAIIGMHAQAGIPHGAHAPTLPMAPHPSLAGMPPSSGAPHGLLSAVSSASLMGLPAHPLSMLGKPDLGRADDKRERAEERAAALLDERAESWWSPGFPVIWV
nr:transducin-like enhancer protein 3-B isoform X2 [Procambarus clarkii]